MRRRKRTRPSDSAKLVQWLFLRGLGAVYFIAFRSLAPQVLGLFGARGLAPVREELAGLRSLPLRTRLRLVPSLLWLDPSDRALIALCRKGETLSLALLLGVEPRRSLLALWLLYLSLVSAGGEFLSFQWDVLLLETGLHALLVAPPGSRARLRDPPLAGRLLLRWLAVRLQLESGLCKLQSKDPTWRSCTACTYHYETQPLPTRIGWYVHHLPRRLQIVSTFIALGIELAAPPLALLPGRILRGFRLASFASLTVLQLLIALTGNYGFFNLLTVIDSLWMLDDRALNRLLFPMFKKSRNLQEYTRRPWWREVAWSIAASPLALLSFDEIASRLLHRRLQIPSLTRLRRGLAPLRSINGYGLFAQMTTERPEIAIEGSDDGRTWREYEFRFKPGDPRRPPRQAAPHQPRLDWPMWFAALDGAPDWFPRLLQRLLENEPTVTALLARNPFPMRPPRFVRAVLYEYRMTSLAEHRESGAYWRRRPLGLYFPPCTLAHRNGATAPERSWAEPPHAS